MSDQPRTFAAPEISPETAPYWEAAERGELLVKTCSACGKAHYYPRTLCPFCFSADTRWEKAKGTGRVYSYSVMRRAAVPYVMAYVTLDEGVTMMTNIVDCDVDDVSIDDRVAVVFKATEGGPPIPCFTPLRDA